jgi:hypothetical protein
MRVNLWKLIRWNCHGLWLTPAIRPFCIQPPLQFSQDRPPDFLLLPAGDDTSRTEQRVAVRFEVEEAHRKVGCLTVIK